MSLAEYVSTIFINALYNTIAVPWCISVYKDFSSQRNQSSKNKTRQEIGYDRYMERPKMIYTKLRQLLLGKHGNTNKTADIRHRVIKGTYSCKKEEKRKNRAYRHRRKWNTVVGNVVLIRNHESGMNKLGECKYNKLSCPAICSTEEEPNFKA